MATPIFDNEEQMLEWQLAEATRKLAAIKAARALKEKEEQEAAAEAKRLAEIEEAKNKRFIINIEDVTSQRMVSCRWEFNPEIVHIAKDVPGRTYSGHGYNGIPLEQWETFVADVKEGIENVEFVFTSPEIETKLQEKLAEPIWEIELGQYALQLKTRSTNIWPIRQIPGAEFNRERAIFYIPRSEAWQLFKVLSTQDKVKWSDDALAFVEDQLKKRETLDRIATMDRGEKYLDFAFTDSNGVQIVKLRNFQEVGCDFMDAANGRALLADDMGLGKTIQSLAVAWHNKWRTLIVCPASLKNNWARQILKLTGLRPKVLKGAEPTKLDIVDLLIDPVPFTIINYDILGRKQEFRKESFDQEGHMHLSDEVRFPWAEVIQMAKFDNVIYDEAHYFKGTETNRWQAIKTIDTPHVIEMTGTPVLNRPGEYWPLLHKINPLMFPSHDTFLRQYTNDGKTAKNVEELRNALRTIMIRRLQRDVKKDLPPINRVHDYHELSPKGQKLYDKVLAGIYSTMDAAGSNVDKIITNILVQIQRLKQVCAIDKVEGTAELAMNLYDQTDASEHRKVLIFSQYKMVAYGIAQRLALDTEALCFVRRVGNDFVTVDNAERDRIVQRFQSDPSIKYLVVTEKTTKEGHDITEAGHVIFNDLFWTPAAHAQAEGRAYGRESDSHNINSYFRIVDMDGKSIDEWIMTLLADKLRMIDEIVEGVESGRDVSIASELIQMFKRNMGR